MISFLLVVPLVCLLIYLGLIFESAGVILLGFTAVVFAVFSLCYLEIFGKGLRVWVEIPMKVVEKGQGFSVKVHADRNKPLPIGKIKVFLSYGERGTKKIRELSVGLDHVIEVERRLSIQAAGCYEFKVECFHVYDPFGWFYFGYHGKSSAQVMVMPTIKELQIRLGEGVKHFYGETMEYDDLMAGQDASEVFDVREFLDGDKLQRIHWKLSARTDELMVKEDSLPKSCAIVLFMPEGVLSRSENLNFMASLSYSLMDAKCPHYVVWQSKSSGDLARVKVQDDDSFYFAIMAFLQDGSVSAEMDRLERYREKYKGEPFLHSVVADEGGAFRMDEGEQVAAEGFEGELYFR